MPPKKNKDKKKNKGDQGQKGETTPTAGDSEPTMEQTTDTQVTESNENFTLNTEEAKVSEDQQTVEFPDAPEETSVPNDNSSQPPVETDAPTTEAPKEETPAIQEETPAIQEEIPAIQEETKAEETIPETVQEETIDNEQKTLHEAIAEESHQQGFEAEEQRAPETVETENVGVKETPAEILKKEDRKEEEIAHVNESENHHATEEPSNNAADEQKINENVAGNEYKIEHEIHSREEESLLKKPDPHEASKVEEVPPIVVEPEVKVADHSSHENKDILTSSVRSEWEEIKPSSGIGHVEQTGQPSFLEGSQRSESQEPNLLQSHVIVEDKSGSNVDLQGSLNKNWDVMVNKPSEHEEEIRSDKASDNAQGTRLMDDIENHIQPSKSSQPQLAEISEKPESLTQEERLRRADDDISKAKNLKEQNRPDEALILLQAAREVLNPDYFSKEQIVLNQVNQKIMECTLETADCYNQLNDFPQSIKYSKAIRKSHPENIRAIYLLGIGLVRVGELEAAHAVLRESKLLALPSTDTLYANLIDKELEKLDQIAESRNQFKRNSSHEEESQSLLIHKPGSVDEKPVEEKPELSPEKKTKDVKPPASSGASAAEYFLGSLVSSGALSFVIAKYLFKFPTKKGVIASLVIGAVVGGVSLITQSALKKSNKDKTNKK